MRREFRRHPFRVADLPRAFVAMAFGGPLAVAALFGFLADSAVPALIAAALAPLLAFILFRKIRDQHNTMRLVLEPGVLRLDAPLGWEVRRDDLVEIRRVDGRIEVQGSQLCVSAGPEWESFDEFEAAIAEWGEIRDAVRQERAVTMDDMLEHAKSDHPLAVQQRELWKKAAPAVVFFLAMATMMVVTWLLN